MESVERRIVPTFLMRAYERPLIILNLICSHIHTRSESIDNVSHLNLNEILLINIFTKKQQ